VVEARERSGALITADFALEEGREVFACPGEITSSLSTGSNALLRIGATPLTSSADVLEVFGLRAADNAEADVSATAKALLAELNAPLTGDEIVRASGIGAAAALAALSELELAGLVSSSDGVFRRTGR
jgi:DNA processing protein